MASRRKPQEDGGLFTDPGIAAAMKAADAGKTPVVAVKYDRALVRGAYHARTYRGPNLYDRMRAATRPTIPDLIDVQREILALLRWKATETDPTFDIKRAALLVDRVEQHRNPRGECVCEECGKVRIERARLAEEGYL